MCFLCRKALFLHLFSSVNFARLISGHLAPPRHCRRRRRYLPLAIFLHSRSRPGGEILFWAEVTFSLSPQILQRLFLCPIFPFLIFVSREGIIINPFRSYFDRLTTFPPFWPPVPTPHSPDLINCLRSNPAQGGAT